MSNLDLCRLTIDEAAPLIERREISPVELTEAFLARIERLNTELCAYVRITADTARAQAAAAEREIASGRYKEPLHRVPLALKDIYDTAGVQTIASSH